MRPEDLIPQPYRVHPGDVLELTITDIVGPGIETRKVLRVSASGTISLPLLGSIPVAGLTEEELTPYVQKLINDNL